jgi:hypothetical protein
VPGANVTNALPGGTFVNLIVVPEPAFGGVALAGMLAWRLRRRCRGGA